MYIVYTYSDYTYLYISEVSNLLIKLGHIKQEEVVVGRIQKKKKNTIKSI